MKKNYFAILSVLFFISAHAAYAWTITGKVTDETGKPLVFASVLLLHKADSVLMKTELTGEDGQYQFTLADNGEYLIKAVFAGYKTIFSDPVIISGNNVTVPGISLQQTTAQLKEVAVRAQKPFIEVKPDMLVVNVENSIVSAGSSVMDVLARSPGVRVDQDDNISLKGKAGVNIMMDGKMLSMSGQDLANMLRSMPSTTVDKIELISNPSAKYDAAGTAGIINIITKRDQRMGFNGSAKIAYGQGIYHGEYGNFDLNYRNKKFSAYANYSVYYHVGLNDVLFFRRFYNAGIPTGAYDQHNYTTVPSTTHTALAGLDYSLSPKTTIGVSMKAQSNSHTAKGFYYSKVLDSADIERSYFTTTNASAELWNNYVPNLHLKHAFDTTGRQLTTDLDYGRYTNSYNQDFTTNYYWPDGSLAQTPYLLHGFVPGITQVRAAKADYSSPLKGNMHFDAGIKGSLVTADNQPQFFDRSNGGNIYDSGKSDHFLYTENINAAYVNANREWTKLSMQLGLRAEQTIATGTEKTNGASFERNYTQLFPSFAVQRHLNPDNDLGISLSRRIERPNYEQLNPFRFYVDPSTYRSGNPYLEPALSYNIELSHVYKQRFITTLYYNHTTNVITDIVLPADIKTHVAEQIYVNLGLVEYYGISGSYNIPVNKWWTSVTNVNGYYSKYNALLVNTPLTNGQFSYDVHSTNSFLLPSNWSAEVTVQYQSLLEYGYLNIKPNWMLNAGIQKNLLDKRMTLKLVATDIFYTGYQRGYSNFTDYTISFNGHRDNRQVAMSLTYRFGNKALPAAGHHKAGAEEEERRAEANT